MSKNEILLVCTFKILLNVCISCVFKCIRRTRGHLMCNQEPPICPTCNAAFSIKHNIPTECLANEEENYNLPPNLFEVIGPDYH